MFMHLIGRGLASNDTMFVRVTRLITFRVFAVLLGRLRMYLELSFVCLVVGIRRSGRFREVPLPRVLFGPCLLTVNARPFQLFRYVIGSRSAYIAQDFRN